MYTTSARSGSAKRKMVNGPPIAACAPTWNGRTCRVTAGGSATSMRCFSCPRKIGRASCMTGVQTCALPISQDGERAAHCGVRADLERQDLQGHRRVIGHLDEVLQLPADDLGAADRAA